MEKYNLLERHPGILGGKPIVKGTRISVSIILEWLGTGGTPEKINERYPQVSIESVRQALLYASEEISSTEIVELSIAA